ncbi:MAG TPA: sigma-70 family RNA polymerase sigma factor [Planococcus sp. (in: firmicutes)]|nr:sigma-70 family RNA polymerase sigma factor [Planococcus sp. (in: firmicutes)]
MKDFEKVLEQYSPMISAMIRKLHIYRDHESYRQAGRVALWQAWQRFDHNKGNFTPFAYSSIRGAMLDELKREASLAAAVAVMENTGYEMKSEERLIDELPEWLDPIYFTPEEKRLLEDLFLKGISVSQLSEIHGISLSGMKKRRERLLNKIRNSLEN